MTNSVKTDKMLWGRAASRCAICRCELVINATETDDESIIGEACHIVAQKVNGPRGNSPLDSTQRDLYPNLMLLCNVHHKMIDDQSNTYTVEKLKEIKAIHEKWVQNSLQEFDPVKQLDDERYASYIEDWAKLADLNNWTDWSSLPLGVQPRLSITQNENLTKLGPWIFNRIWPKRYEELESAFTNFQRVLEDFLEVFHTHAEELTNNNIFRTPRFYQISEWNEQRYNHLFKEYQFHVDLVTDLILELTRAANYICDKVRLYIATNYRLEEGVLLVCRPFEDLSLRYYRPEYKGIERVVYPYPRLNKFKEIRTTRDISFGSGLNPEDDLDGCNQSP